MIASLTDVFRLRRPGFGRRTRSRSCTRSPTTLVDPLPYAKVRGAGFYRQFLDNAEWASFMREGRVSGLAALSALDQRIRG